VEGHGTTFFVFDFPNALPATIRGDFDGATGEKLAQAVEAALARHKFEREDA
jgi:hypothetical protein